MSDEERIRRRRRFALRLAPLAVGLVVVGYLIASNSSGLLNLLGYLMLMQGVGLGAAILPLAFGHNPLSRE